MVNTVYSCATSGTNLLFPFSDINIYSCATRDTNLLFLFSDNNGTQILVKIAKGGWFSVLRNIYQNDVKELLKQNESIVEKREFYFALKLYEIAQRHSKILQLTIQLRDIKSNISILKNSVLNYNYIIKYIFF